MRKWPVVVALASIAIAACSSGSSGGEASDESNEEASEDVAVEEARSETGGSPAPATDAAPPADVPAAPGGAIGYSPYVFEDDGTKVVTSLVEGPRGEQVRCQDPDLPCSHLDIKELAESADPVPEELGMSRSELEELADQLGQVESVIENYRDVNKACADGYFRATDQVPNMGSHFLHNGRTADGAFDPAEPEMLLYVSADGELPAPGTAGDCVNGRWEGQPMDISGVSFVLPHGQVGDDHPEAFAGPLDNWHVHYNLCSGPNVAGGSRTLNPEACQEEGGAYLETYGWMIHAWADPQHDNQLGVFAMWNPSIAPMVDPQAIYDARVRAPQDLPEGAEHFAISNFSFDTIEVAAGDPVVFSNADGVVHTVTAGSANEPGDAFDSGNLSPGQTYEATFEDPGSYNFFCTLHPQMNGRIIVE
jgi:hypothetical protein